MPISKKYNFKIAALSKLLLITALLPTLSSCASRLSSDVYTTHSTKEAAMAFRGVILTVRQVTVESGDKIEDNGAGMLAGGVAGGVVGNQFGGGSGNAIATVAGIVVGAFAGAHVEQSLKQQEAFEYVVQLENGEMRVVIQGMDTLLSPGQPVLLIASYSGRPRLILDHTVIQVQQQQAY